jgi:hypothetical protein
MSSQRFVFSVLTSLTLLGMMACSSAPKENPTAAVASAPASSGQPADATLKKEVPAPARKEIITISGLVLTGEGIADIPVKDVKVMLISSENLVMREGKTNASGAFSLSGKIKPGEYRIKVMSSTYRGEEKFQVDGYDVTDLSVVVKGPPAKR